jgi:RimJ/RimL family protein N-acetyltransferase
MINDKCSMKSFTIRKLTEDDWLELSQIRLKALLSDPQVFGSNYEREKDTPEADWRKLLRSDENAIFLIYENEKPIGMTCISIDRDDETKKTALMWGSWLAHEFRRRGLSELMYRTRIDWAKKQPTVEKITVSHRASNLSSKFANQKHGFKFTHTKEKIWTDSTTEDEVCYELQIKLAYDL